MAPEPLRFADARGVPFTDEVGKCNGDEDRGTGVDMTPILLGS